MARFTVSDTVFELDPERIEEPVGGVLPDPVREHYVVVRGRRYPPRQVIACVTGLDQADFTTHEARRILRRLGFVAARTVPVEETPDEVRHDWPYGGLLGQEGFLRSFRVTLCAAEYWLEVEPQR